MEDENKCMGIFVDVTKAFDTVNHNILLEKTKLYGIRGKSLYLIQSCFINSE